MKITLDTLKQHKEKHIPIVALTAYDASFAMLMAATGVDVILVGDSLGNVIQGHSTTIPVSISDTTYHTRAVARGNAERAFLIADMPFMTYANSEQACKYAKKLMQAGAMMVKLEGGSWLLPVVTALVERGIPVCGHLGLKGQSVHQSGGFKMQGKTEQAAEDIMQDAIALEKAGAQLLVLECIPAALAAKITQLLTIPVIGIGAGNQTDGQVLVSYDILGLSPFIPKFTKNFLAGCDSIKTAIERYCQAVRDRSFP